MQSSSIFKKILTPVLFLAMAWNCAVHADTISRRRGDSKLQWTNCSFAMDSNAVNLKHPLKSGHAISEYQALIMIQNFLSAKTIEGLHFTEGHSLLYPDMNKRCSLVGNQTADSLILSGMFTLFVGGRHDTESYQILFSEHTDIRILRFNPPRVIQFQVIARGITHTPIIQMQFEHLPNGYLRVDYKSQSKDKNHERHVACLFK